jgi:hypothetical protein
MQAGRNIPRKPKSRKAAAKAGRNRHHALRDEFHRLINHYVVSFNTVSFNTSQSITPDDRSLLMK